MKKSVIVSFLVFLPIFFLVIFPLSRYLDVFGIDGRDVIADYYTATGSPLEVENWKEGFFKNEFELHQALIDLGIREDTVFIGLDLSPYLEENDDPKFLEIINPTFRSVALYRVNVDGDVVHYGNDGIQYSLKNKFGNPNPTFKITDSKDWLPYVILKIS